MLTRKKLDVTVGVEPSLGRQSKPANSLCLLEGVEVQDYRGGVCSRVEWVIASSGSSIPTDSRPSNGETFVTRKGLGLWMCTALVMGNMIGSGVFLLPAALAPYGTISLLGWLFTASGAVLLAVLFGSLARIRPAVGGPYAYARAGFGDFAGFMVAWGYWIAVWAGNSAIAVGFAGYVGFLVPAVGDDPVLGATTALLAIWLLTAVNTRGVHVVGWVALGTTVLKVMPLLAIGTVGFLYVNGSNFLPFNPSGGSAVSGVTACAALTLWAFLGLESATVPADNVESPETTIPRATVLGTILAAAIYILSTGAVLGLIPRQALMVSTAPFADAASAVWGGAAATVVAAGAVIAAFGALNGWILLAGQIPLAAARDGLFPEAFSRVSSSGMPTVGLVVSGVLASLLLLLNYTRGLVEMFTFIILLATLNTLIPYALCSLAYFLMPRSEEGAYPNRTIGHSLVAVVAFLYSAWAILGAGKDAVYWGSLLLLAGIPVFVWLKRPSAQ